MSVKLGEYQSGTDVNLPNIDPTSTIGLGNTIFTAPTVVGEGASEVLVFELTVRDNEGATATDQVSVTVNAVNASPTVNAGTDQVVDEDVKVNLQGAASDTDGTIASYLWEQTAGPTVAIVNENQANANFIAPATTDQDTLEFTLTVTDNEGSTQTDTMSVAVFDINTPDLAVHFPPATGRFTGTEIDVFGTAGAKGLATTISSLTITIGAGIVNATVNPDGSWRAENVALPNGITDIAITVAVVDSNGRDRSAVINLVTAGLAGAGNTMKEDVRGIAINTDNNRAYVLTSGNFVGSADIHVIDLNTGSRDNSLFDNAPAKGTSLIFPNGLSFDSSNNRLLITDDSVSAIIATDLSTWQREIVSSTDVGSGNDFGFAVGSALDALNGLLYVADNELNQVIEVDLANGNRTVIADEGSSTKGVNRPIALVYDSINDQLIVTENLTGSTPLLGVDLSSSPAATSNISQTNVNAGPPLVEGIFGVATNATGTSAYVLAEDKLLTVDLSSGDRTLVADTDFEFSSFTMLNDIEYNVQRQIIYAAGKPVGSTTNTLQVINPQSGDIVVLSE